MNKTITNLSILNKNIILVGFQGSKPKKLKAYKKMYKNFGFKNINVICPDYLENYDVRKVQPLGKSIFNQVINNNEYRKINCTQYWKFYRC